MQEKPAEACDGVEGHRTLPIAARGILPSARHLAMSPGEEAPIGDGHARRGAGEGAEPLLRPSQWGRGGDDPLHLRHGREALLPSRGGTPALALSLHAEALLRRRLPPRRADRAPQQPTQDTHREKEAFGARDPRGAVQRQPPRRHEAMEVGMMVQGLAPGMQDRQASALGPSMPRSTGHRLQRLGHGLPQEGLHDTGMLQREGTARGGEGKDHMAGGPLAHLPLPRRQPGGLGPPWTRRAVPMAARMIADFLRAPGIARRFVAAEDCRAARRDGLEHAAWRRGGPRARAGERGSPIRLDKVSDVERWAGHGWPSEVEANGKGSRGRGMLDNAWGVPGRERLVVRRLWGPHRSWRRRPSTPASSP